MRLDNAHHIAIFLGRCYSPFSRNGGGVGRQDTLSEVTADHILYQVSAYLDDLAGRHHAFTWPAGQDHL